MKKLSLAVLLLICFSCSKQDDENPKPDDSTNTKAESKYVEEHTAVNKKTGWYVTNKLFNGTFFIDKSKVYNLFEYNGKLEFADYIPNAQGFFSNRTTVIMGDLNSDGKNDILNNYWAAPFGTNKPGYYATWEHEKAEFTKPNISKGLTAARKFIFNDYSGNGSLSLLVASHGADLEPFPGDIVQIVDFGKDLSMTTKNISDIKGFFHTGASGDIDNDGDIDVLMYAGGSFITKAGPVYLKNIGNGTFQYTSDLIQGLGYEQHNPNNYYTMELFDVNKDGYLDIILGGNNKEITSRIIWGSNLAKFDASNQSILPTQASYSGVVDIAFTDLEKDGDIDLILLHEINYRGFGIQILENRNNAFIDVTSSRVDVASVSNAIWTAWIRLFDVDNDGDYDLVTDGFGYLVNQNTAGAQPTPKINWINDGKGNFKSSFVY
jgi:hypothetical protein